MLNGMPLPSAVKKSLREAVFFTVFSVVWSDDAVEANNFFNLQTFYTQSNKKW